MNETVHLRIRLNIDGLPGGGYRATSDDVPGLCAQGRAVPEAIEAACDAARNLMGASVLRGRWVGMSQAEKLADPEWAATHNRMMKRLRRGMSLGGVKVNRDEIYGR